jgi:hypothetical protein
VDLLAESSTGLYALRVISREGSLRPKAYTTGRPYRAGANDNLTDATIGGVEPVENPATAVVV